MKILFNDVVQYSSADFALKSPALSETVSVAKDATIEIDLNGKRNINAVGIGNTNGTKFNITLIRGSKRPDFDVDFTGNGLYPLPLDCPIEAEIISIKLLAGGNDSGFYIGRFGAGIGVDIPTSVAKSPGFASTASPRRTLSGQVIAGAGGYNYRTLSLDSRYKIDEKAMLEIEAGYKYISVGYPFFIDLSDEKEKLLFSEFYAVEREQKNMSFEGGITKFLYSRRWDFEEAF